MNISNCCLCGDDAHWQCHNKRWGLFCNGCRATSGYHKTKEAALNSWNNEMPTRTKPTIKQMNNIIKLLSIK